MIKRLGIVASVVVGFSVLTASAASAAQCAGTQTVLGVCSSSQPSQTTSQPAPQPSQPAPQPAPGASQPAPAQGTIAEEPGAASRLLQLVNRDRAAAGLAPLEGRSGITSIAAGHSQAMARQRTIWHNNAYFTAGTREALRARALGENVALNGSVDDAHRRLMASPGHRANILNASFDAVGISVVHDERGVFYVTQNFVDSLGAAPAVVKTAAAPKTSPPAPQTRKPAVVAPPAAPAALPEAGQPAHMELDHVLATATTAETKAPGGGVLMWLMALVGATLLLALVVAATRLVA